MPEDMENSLEYARLLDKNDELAKYRNKFLFPEHTSGTTIYLNGNSLGLQPKNAKDMVLKELKDWSRYAVEGHFKGDTPWLNYHELLTKPMANIVGCKPIEVVMMNSLTVNLHLMLVSFYNPTPDRYKILIEYSTFPSDQYAVKSQIRLNGYNPEKALVELKPNQEFVTMEEIKRVLNNHGDEIALVLIGGVNYYTGQVYDMEKITKLAHEKGCIVGYDLAHAVGNIELKLHDWNVDFAVWCTYKYLNSGPGSIGGCFVHEKHAITNLPRLAGWWGHDKKTRFLMKPDFNPIPGAEGWQISNPSILSLATTKASLDLFEEVGMEKLAQKSQKLIDFARLLLGDYFDYINIITPKEPQYRGCQLSIVIEKNGKWVYEELNKAGIYCDWREPDVIRVAFSPFYNNFEDVYQFTTILGKLLQ